MAFDYQNSETYENGIILTRDAGINSILDLRLYTDGLATFGRESNGLVQTSASFKHIIHRNNYPNTGWFTPLHYMKFNVDLRKFDSQFSSTDTTDFTRSTYLQRNWLSSELAFSLYNIWVEKKSLSSFYIDGGAEIFLSDLGIDDNIETTISYAFFIQPGFDFRVSKNFGSDLSWKFFWHYSPETDFNDQNERRPFLDTKFDLFWNPLGDRSSRIFGRVSHTIDLDTKDSFFQLQLGYSLRLTDLIKK